MTGPGWKLWQFRSSLTPGGQLEAGAVRGFAVPSPEHRVPSIESRVGSPEACGCRGRECPAACNSILDTNCFWRCSPNPSRSEFVSLYTGTLINDLFATVEKAERAAASRSRQDLLASSSDANRGVKPHAEAGSSEPEQFAQPLGLSPADWNLALLLVIHAQLVRTLEPGHDFANAVDVHQVGAVSTPEQTGIEASQ